MVHFQLSPARPKKAVAAGHVRSAREPCRSHPVVARLDDSVHMLRSWPASGSDVSAGLGLVGAAIAVLGELLELPQAVAALRGLAAADRLLDGFLLLADAYGSFESALVALKQQAAELQAAVRRVDGARLAAARRSHRRTEKELSRLAAAMREASRCASPSRAPADSAGAEVVGIVTEAAAAMAVASEAIFTRCAALSPPMSALAATVSTKKWLARLGVMPAAKKAAPQAAMAALGRLEECIGELEGGSEKVFRSLLQTLVSLLNIHTSF